MKVASYGLLTVGGIVAMILGAMMLVDAPVPEMQVPLRMLLPAAAGHGGGDDRCWCGWWCRRSAAGR